MVRRYGSFGLLVICHLCQRVSSLTPLVLANSCLVSCVCVCVWLALRIEFVTLFFSTEQKNVRYGSFGHDVRGLSSRDLPSCQSVSPLTPLAHVHVLVNLMSCVCVCVRAWLRYACVDVLTNFWSVVICSSQNKKHISGGGVFGRHDDRGLLAPSRHSHILSGPCTYPSPYPHLAMSCPPHMYLSSQSLMHTLATLSSHHSGM